MPDPIRLGFPVSFLEAIKWAENRKAVLPETYYGELAKELRSTAFTVSGISRLDVIEQIMTSLADQTKAGATFASWKKWVADNAPEVFQLPKGRAETIFRNAIQTNYNAGRWEQQWAARDVFPYLMWSAINDARTRPTHRALSGIIRRIDDPFWQRVGYPPAGHNCRCTTIALTEKQAQRRSGVDTGLNKPVTPDMHADPGWEYHPVLQQTRMEDIAKQKLDRMGAMMRIALENVARAAPAVPLADKALSEMSVEEVQEYGAWKTNQLVKNFDNKVKKYEKQYDEITKELQMLNEQHKQMMILPKGLTDDEYELFVERRKVIRERIMELNEKHIKLMLNNPCDKLLESISKAKWTGYNKREIKKWLKQKYKFEFTDAQLEGYVRQNVNDFVDQFGPKLGSTYLKEFRYVEKRAWASPDGTMNVGDGGWKGTIFHEFGHFVEFEDAAKAKAATDWRTWKSQGKPQLKLNLIVEGSSYEDWEIALLDDYIDPYVGKIYQNDITEVVSMGMQYFVNGSKLLDLYRKDKSHFNFIMAILFK